MGTFRKPGREELVADIRLAFSVMGFSERSGAGRLYDELNPGSDDEGERRAFVEAFRKQLQRTTTSVSTLQKHLSDIQKFAEFKKSDLHYLKPLKSSDLPQVLIEEINEISGDILKEIRSRQK